tara:strand:- start:41 stop:682 length:642 start_codon:yes stop_codon:yes gene_type:complete
MKQINRGLIVCGTDTDVGKTIVSSLLVQGLNAIYWKPIQSGIENGTDTNRVCELLDLSQDRWIPEVYKFQSAVSPHWAAEIDNQRINPSLLHLPRVSNPLIIETAGGLMVPLNREFLQIDQLQSWGLDILLVARSGLGTLNHTLLSIEALRKRNINIFGLILNGPLHKDNPKTLEEFGDVPIIAQLPILKSINSHTLADEWAKQNLGFHFNMK